MSTNKTIRGMPRRCTRGGFTLIEMVVVIVVGMILVSIATRGLSGVRNSAAVRNGEQILASMHARARAHAIERGEPSILRINPTTDVVTIEIGSDTIDIVRFLAALSVDIAVDATLIICFHPRGYTYPGCSNISVATGVVLTTGGESRTTTFLPLGQIKYW